MPQPDLMFLDYDPDEAPSVQLDVLGRGAKNRKSKTLLPNIELAMLLGLAREHIQHLFETFRKLHAHHYEVPELDEDGEPVILEENGVQIKKMVPEILTDAQIRQFYPSVAKWESFHQEQVDHYPSVGGFSTKAALGYDEKTKNSERRESSAGTDRPQNSNNKWE